MKAIGKLWRKNLQEINIIKSIIAKLQVKCTLTLGLLDAQI